MDILACIKQVPANTNVALDDTYSLRRDAISQIINPADESAIELGLELRDKHGGSVCAITMGTKAADRMLREISSRGVDTLYHLNDAAFAGADTFATSRTLYEAVRKVGPFDLILCGRRSMDGETGQVGPELAALLDVPVITNVIDLRLENKIAMARRLLENGFETLTFLLPAVVTICEWSYPLRLPTIPGLKRARTIPVRCLEMSDLEISRENCGLEGSPTRVIRATAQSRRVRHAQISYDAVAGAETALKKVRERCRFG